MKMAEGRQGGMRTPRNPAPVSAPGALSRRTDGGPQQVQTPMTGMAYGENRDFEEMQSAAPMSASPSAKSPAARSRQASASASQTRVPMFSQTQRPDEPVTAGAPFGPGVGEMPAMAPNVTAKPKLTDTLRKIQMSSNDPRVSQLLRVFELRGW
jgi:hypothetical protein